jgi:hypothetical protein
VEIKMPVPLLAIHDWYREMPRTMYNAAKVDSDFELPIFFSHLFDRFRMCSAPSYRYGVKVTAEVEQNKLSPSHITHHTIRGNGPHALKTRKPEASASATESE